MRHRLRLRVPGDLVAAVSEDGGVHLRLVVQLRQRVRVGHGVQCGAGPLRPLPRLRRGVPRLGRHDHALGQVRRQLVDERADVVERQPSLPATARRPLQAVVEVQVLAVGPQPVPVHLRQLLGHRQPCRHHGIPPSFRRGAPCGRPAQPVEGSSPLAPFVVPAEAGTSTLPSAVIPP